MRGGFIATFSKTKQERRREKSWMLKLFTYNKWRLVFNFNSQACMLTLGIISTGRALHVSFLPALFLYNYYFHKELHY